MTQILNWITSYNGYIVFYLLIANILLGCIIIFLSAKISRIQKKYTTFMKRDDMDLEQLLSTYAEQVRTLEVDMQNHTKLIENLEQRMQTTIRKVSITRYKAIENVGADLSFIITLLDEHNNGVVVNGIYSRDGSYTYAKPILEGESKYVLSEEEKKTLQEAISK
ncbi:MAG: hypothetical protein ATN35_09385 [Epulopiscium sp. Nele67-Bin004]|nr:MAG: hypothetical protein ATN35_09385 [Epulopiscium sp. Nele67-Bin004]